MNKFFLYIICFLLFSTSLSAKEPTLATLRSVNSNDYQKFSIGMYEFICRPYGVITIEELYNNSDNGSSCQKSIEEFYMEKPMSKYFTLNLLKDRQLYHIEIIDRRCLLYARGKVTMSELLIKNGLALVEPKFKNEEFKHTFIQAQNYAKNLKAGLFKNKIMNKCISELYKN